MNYVSDDFFELDSHEPQENLKFLMVCNLKPQKNIALALESWKRFSEKTNSHHLTIIGNGPIENEIRTFIEQNQLSNSVSLRTDLTRKETIQQFESADVLISSSRTETFGLTVAEAHAAGIPVLATDSGGVRDIINDRNGIIAGHTADEFVSGLEKISSNISTYNSSEIRETSRSRFSKSVFLEMLKIHYDS